jgi:hypothetical protein
VVDDPTVRAEIDRTRRGNPDDRRLAEFLSSARGRDYVRSTLRRSHVVEGIIDRWIEAHPQFAEVRHIEDQLERSSDQLDAAAEAVEPIELDEEDEKLEAELTAAGVSGASEDGTDR